MILIRSSSEVVLLTGIITPFIIISSVSTLSSSNEICEILLTGMVLFPVEETISTNSLETPTGTCCVESSHGTDADIVSLNWRSQ